MVLFTVLPRAFEPGKLSHVDVFPASFFVQRLELLLDICFRTKFSLYRWQLLSKQRYENDRAGINTQITKYTKAGLSLGRWAAAVTRCSYRRAYSVLSFVLGRGVIYVSCASHQTNQTMMGSKRGVLVP